MKVSMGAVLSPGAMEVNTGTRKDFRGYEVTTGDAHAHYVEGT